MAEDAVRVLLVNTHSLDHLGGAELGLRYQVDHAPPHVDIVAIKPDQKVDLNDFDAVILANLRPEGGVGEAEECAWAELWLRRLIRYPGFVMRSEHDLHPCGMRDAQCVSCPLYEKIPCNCTPRIPATFARLYHRCQVVQFLSPAHQKVINAIIPIESPQVVIASPIDVSLFSERVPRAQRPRTALIVGDAIRVAPTAAPRALDNGYHPVRMPYLSVPYAEWPAVLNSHQAVVVDPIMFHAFGRIVVEAKLCGCDVLVGPRVGAMSWADPVQAVREANQRFWDVVVQGAAEWGGQRRQRKFAAGRVA